MKIHLDIHISLHIYIYIYICFFFVVIGPTLLAKSKQTWPCAGRVHFHFLPGDEDPLGKARVFSIHARSQCHMQHSHCAGVTAGLGIQRNRAKTGHLAFPRVHVFSCASCVCVCVSSDAGWMGVLMCCLMCWSIHLCIHRRLVAEPGCKEMEFRQMSLEI